MLDVIAAEFCTCLDQVIFLQLALLVEVQMLEQCLHLFEEAAVHEDGADAAEELIEVDVLLAAFVQQAKNALHDLRRVLQAQHLDYLDEVEAFDA